MFVKEQPPGLNLLDVDADHEVQMHPGADDFTAYHFRVPLVVVQGLLGTPGRAHNRANDHGRLLGADLEHGLGPFGGDIDIPGHAVVWVKTRQV